MPPSRLSAIVRPIDATEPDTRPRLYANVFANSSAAFCMSESVTISIRLILIPSMCFWISSNTAVSPRPSQNPFTREDFSSLSLSIIPCRRLSTSSVPSGSEPMSKSSASYPPPDAPPPDPLLPELSAGLIIFNSSIPVDTPFMSLAAFLAAPPAPLAADPALSAAFATASIPAAAADAPPPSPFLPVISSVKARNALARLISFPIIVFITWITGDSTLISPWPIVAFKLSNCSCKMRTWFAQPFDVREKSPAAVVS